ncbi:MAG: glycosyltransferase family 4 protein [Acidobacteriota bacterium]
MSSGGRRRVALLPSEPLRPQMAGIGIRYLELARRLPGHGLDVVLLTSGEVSEVPETGLPEGAIRTFEAGRLKEILADCDVAVAQGQLANDLLYEVPDLPSVVDLYDPFLVENFAYLGSLGLDPYRNDHATWIHQMSRGDLFLCSCEEQRQYYLGFLTAVGRINPHLLERDPDAADLIRVVPFGVPDRLPDHEPYLPPAPPGRKRLLFGGLYDWYDPWPVLEAMEACRDEPWSLLLIRNPNPGTPQTLFTEVETWCRRRGLWGESVEVLDWVPGSRRYDLLRDVDLMVATHRASLETRLSLRTRFLDALAAGCPVVTTEGGAMSRLLQQHGAGWVVPEGDADAVAGAFREILQGDGSEVKARRAAGGRLLADFTWDRVLAPLVEFCRDPAVEPTKAQFASRPATAAPPDPFLFRLKRKARRLLGAT